MVLIPESLIRWLTLFVVVTGSFLTLLDLVIINIVMPSITTHFHSSIAQGGWVISGYTLAMAVMLLCSGWFARRYGFKRLYIVGIVIFTVASFLCSISESLNSFIAMRMLQGVGAGIITPLSMSIIALNFTGKDRGFALGLLIMVVGSTVSIGPLLGGYLVDIGRWDWVFKINVPLGIATLLMAIFLMKEYRDKTIPPLDYIGALLLFVWAPLSLYALSSNVEWYIVVTLVIFFALFVLRMIYAKSPLINIDIFKNREFVLAVIVTLCLGTVLQGGSYIISDYLLLGRHYSAYKVGLLFVPIGIIQGVMAPITGSLLPKYGSRLFILVGLFILLIYTYLSYKLHLDTPHWYILLTLCFRGFGIGFVSTSLTNLAFSGATDREVDSVSGVINTVKQLSGSLSVAVITLIIVSNSSGNSELSESGYVAATDSSFIYIFGAIMVAIVAVLAIRVKRPRLSDDVEKNVVLKGVVPLEE